MPDLLTHVLGAFVVLTPVSWRLDGIERRHVTLVMVGAVLPDLSKVRLLVDATVIEGVLGAPWSWEAIHRLGPAVALAGVGAFCFRRGRRLAAFGWLVVGVCLHLLFDLAVIRAGGVAPPYLFPLSWYQPPSADLLLSSDSWPWLLTTPIAVGVWALDRRLRE